MTPERIIGSVGEYLLIEKRTYLGYPYIVWKRPMPRVNEDLLGVVAYLYPSEQDAKTGGKAGGTAFFVRIRSAAGSHTPWYDYVVTNRHNIEEFDARFVRVNTHDKKKPIDIFEGDWEFSTTDDVAACEMPFHRAHMRYNPIYDHALITRDRARDLRIGLGDDLFMVGRFINHDGKERNIPVVRFGTIAMMPEEPIVADGKPQESFLIEIRTIPGFSGSPVFVHMPGDTRGKDSMFKPSIDDQRAIEHYGYLEKCLGIEWCRVKGEVAETPMINGSTFEIHLTTGMSGCIPAWTILDFLQTNEQLKMKREDNEKRVAAQSTAEYTGVRRGSQQTTPKVGEPITIPIPSEEQFNRDLDKTIRRKKKR